jgi:hypothetical protein
MDGNNKQLSGMEMDLKAAGNVSGEHETSQQLQIVSGGKHLAGAIGPHFM